jgi:thiamine monophosphate synthase
MCIMEVRNGQHSSTIAQAMAHNVSTVERDLDMFELLLKARKDDESLATVIEAHDHLRKAYAGLLMQFGIELAEEVQNGHSHAHLHDASNALDLDIRGQERSFIETAHHDASLARRFETR